MSVENTRVQLQLSWSQSLSQSGSPATNNASSYNKILSYSTSGAGAGQCNEMIEQIRTLTSSATETLDLTSSLTNLVGQTAVFTSARAVVVWLLGTAETGPDQSTTGSAATHVVVGNAAATPAFTVAAPNGFFGRAPVVVTGTTHTTTTIDGLGSMTGVAIGATVTGTGIQAGTTLVEINNTANSATLSQTASASATVSLTFTNPGSDSFVVPNSGFCAFGVASALGFTIDSTHKSLKIANGDGAVSAKYVLTILGTA